MPEATNTHALAVFDPPYEIPDTARRATERIREGLGAVAPLIPGTVSEKHPKGKLAPKQDRVDILRKVCTPATFTTALKWLTSGKIESDETRRAYADDVRHWAVALYETTGQQIMDLADVTPDVIRAYVLSAEQAGNSNRTINRRLAALQSLYEYDCYEKGVEANRLVSRYDRKKVTAADRDATGTGALAVRQLQALLGACRTNNEFALISLIYATAGRITEVCNADIDHLKADGDGGYILFLNRKGGKNARPFPVKGDLALLVEDSMDGRRRGPLILNPEKQRYTRSQAASVLTWLGRHGRVWTCPRAGTRKRDREGNQHSFKTCRQCRAITPHVLRATKLTHMHQVERVPADAIRVFADHADIATTLSYIRRADDGKIKDETLKATNDVLGKLVHTLTLTGRRELS